VPIQFLKALLPDPGSLGPLTKGKTCIGVIARGLKDGKRKQVYIYNICDHEACYREVKSQAISYTTGVPAVVGAIMMLTGTWHAPGVWNMEQFDPELFLEVLGPMGLPTVVVDGGEWPEL
jgi:saccharopine dehydrogenase (NAD+, L-lysine-forming)